MALSQYYIIVKTFNIRISITKGNVWNRKYLKESIMKIKMKLSDLKHDYFCQYCTMYELLFKIVTLHISKAYILNLMIL